MASSEIKMRILRTVFTVFISLLGVACSDKDRAQRHNKTALKLIQKHDLQGAEREWREALRLDPSLMQIHMNLGNLYLMRGELDMAVKSYRVAIDGGFKVKELFSNLGIALKNSGKLQEALDAHKQALQLSPDDVDSLYNTSATYLALGNLDEAESLLRIALSINPSNSNVNLNLGSLLIRKMRYEDAIACFEKSGEDERTKGDAKLAIAGVYSLQGDFQKSMKLLKEAVAIDPNILDQVDQDTNLEKLRTTTEFSSYMQAALKARNLAYAFLGSALATDKSREYAGKEMPIVVIAFGSKQDEARERALKHLVDTGWSNSKLQQGSVIDPKAVGQMGSNIAQAYEAAKEHGAHSFVFKD